MVKWLSSGQTTFCKWYVYRQTINCKIPSELTINLLWSDFSEFHVQDLLNRIFSGFSHCLLRTKSEDKKVNMYIYCWQQQACKLSMKIRELKWALLILKSPRILSINNNSNVTGLCVLFIFLMLLKTSLRRSSHIHKY